MTIGCCKMYWLNVSLIGFLTIHSDPHRCLQDFPQIQDGFGGARGHAWNTTNQKPTHYYLPQWKILQIVANHGILREQLSFTITMRY